MEVPTVKLSSRKRSSSFRMTAMRSNVSRREENIPTDTPMDTKIITRMSSTHMETEVPMEMDTHMVITHMESSMLSRVKRDHRLMDPFTDLDLMAPGIDLTATAISMLTVPDIATVTAQDIT